MIYFVTLQPQLFSNNLYSVITIEESLLLLQECPVLQYDSETTGLDCHIDKILCIQFGNKSKDFQMVIDTTTVDILNYKNILETKFIIGQNLKFDIKFLYNFGIIPTKVYDTMLVEQVLFLGFPIEIKKYSLQEIANYRLGIYIDKNTRGQINYRGLDDSVILYAATDVVYLEDIMESQLKDCKEKQCILAAKLESDTVPSMAYLEWCGIKLDEKRWLKKMDEDRRNLEEKQRLLDEFAISLQNPKFYTVNLQGDLFEGFDTAPKCTINWNSSKQVITLAKYLGFNTQVESKITGEDSDSVLEKHLKKQKDINDTFLKLYFDFKEFAKVESTYGQSYLNAINPNTGRIHTEFKQIGSTSGRMSCGSKDVNSSLARLKKLPQNKQNDAKKHCGYPQLQNLPADEKTRSSFVSEKGNLFCSSDFSALESRLGADIYNEHEMLREFLEGSGDMHSLCAKLVYKEELKDIDVKDVKKLRPDLRNAVKPIEFSQQFGGSEFAIASSLGCSIEKARDFKNAYDSGFKGISTFKKKNSQFVRKYGYILICEYTGHKIYWWDHKDWIEKQSSFNSAFWDNYKIIKSQDKENPIIKEVSSHFKAASKWDRLSLNSPTQGTGAIIIKDSMNQLFKWIVTNNYFGKILFCNVVHDELCIEFPEDMKDWFPNIITSYMENSASKYCKKLPIPAEANIGKEWIH